MARKDKKPEKEKPKYRWVKVPEDVVFQNNVLTFFDYIVFLTDRDNRYTKTGPGIRMAGRTRDLFESDEDPGTGIEVGSWVKMHPDDWKTLDDVSESPTCGYPYLSQTNMRGEEVRRIEFGHRVTSFVDAIHEAVDKEPEEDEEEDGDEEGQDSSVDQGEVDSGEASKEDEAVEDKTEDAAE